MGSKPRACPACEGYATETKAGLRVSLRGTDFFKGDYRCSGCRLPVALWPRFEAAVKLASGIARLSPRGSVGYNAAWPKLARRVLKGGKR